MTKSFLPLIILLSAALDLPGQSFVDKDNRWNILTEFGVGAQFFSLRFYRFGDTVNINEMPYLRLESTQDSNLVGFTPTFHAFREDSAGKVYYYDLHFNHESIIYDFGLDSVGQVFYWNPGYPPYIDSLEVISIDSVEMLDGSYRTRWKLRRFNDTWMGDVEWIKGIGALESTFLPGNIVILDGSDRIRCFFYKEEHLYGVPANGGCNYLIVNSREAQPVVPPRLLPTLSDGSLWLEEEEPDAEGYELSLVSATGLVTNLGKVRGGQTVALPSSLSNGVYFYRLMKRGEQVGGGRVVVIR
jgi:hypothetical protein